MGKIAQPAVPPSFRALLDIVNPWLDESSGAAAAPAFMAGLCDWPNVLALARRHRVVPFLAYRLGKLGLLDELPPEVASAIRQEARVANFHEMAMLGIVKRLKQRFDEQGITFLIIKGLVLSSGCYGRLGLRVNRDVDVLISPEQLKKAHLVLTDMNFTRVEPAGELSPEELETWIRRNKDWVYLDPITGTVVEIHHRLFDNKALFNPTLTGRTRMVDLFGQIEVQTLNSYDEVAYLALHGALHAWSRLKWLLDLGFIFRDTGPDELTAMLDSFHGDPAARAALQATNLCREFFGVEPLKEKKSSLAVALLTAAARRVIVHGGVTELEDSRFGTTLKNASHYLLWQNRSYLAAELTYDLTDTSRDDPSLGTNELPKWIARLVMWVGRHFSRRGAQ